MLTGWFFFDAQLKGGGIADCCFRLSDLVTVSRDPAKGIAVATIKGGCCDYDLNMAKREDVDKLLALLKEDDA